MTIALQWRLNPFWSRLARSSGAFREKYAVIGGAVPWLFLDNLEMPHVGTIDVDLSLDAEALGDGEYVRLVEALMSNGYNQNKKLKKFHLVTSSGALQPPMGPARSTSSLTS
jgi:hypothetical protein